MCTGRIRMLGPGILAPRDTATPSSGWTVRMIWLGWTPNEPVVWKARCGTGLSWTTISVLLRTRRLPVCRENGTPDHLQATTCSRIVSLDSVIEDVTSLYPLR